VIYRIGVFKRDVSNEMCFEVGVFRRGVFKRGVFTEIFFLKGVLNDRFLKGMFQMFGF